MKVNKLLISIDRPVKEVFAFTTNPKKTHLWIPGIVMEKTNEWPIRLGTIYENVNRRGNWSKYTVCVLEENKIFELVLKNGNYHVRYTYTDLGNGAAKLEYLEWVDNGMLEDPFTQDILEKLKEIIESSRGGTS